MENDHATLCWNFEMGTHLRAPLKTHQETRLWLPSQKGGVPVRLQPHHATRFFVSIFTSTGENGLPV
jgi:hypothetical protein